MDKVLFFIQKCGVHNVYIWFHSYPQPYFDRQKIMDQFDIHFQVAFLHKHEDVDKPVDINIILWTTSFEFLEYLY